MYVESVRIQNLKLLRDVKLDFMRNGSPRPWTVIIGENGCGKTSLLQAIGLAAMGVDRANQLADVTSLPDRRSKNEVKVEATFRFGEGRSKLRKLPLWDGDTIQACPQLKSSLKLKSDWNVFEGGSSYVEREASPTCGTTSVGEDAPRPQVISFSDPLREARRENLAHWFVAGYGVTRSLPIPQPGLRVKDVILERMASLFRPGSIVGTGFADMFDKTSLVRDFCRQLQAALVSGGVLPNVTQLDLRGKGGIKKAQQLVESHRFVMKAGSSEVKIPAVWLSQGYQATAAWVADLIGQQFWDAEGSVELADMEGLVLIDELDLFLHPVWQAQLIPALKHIFPRIQFIVTTHSPMLLPGCEQDEVFILRQDENGDVNVHPAEASPAIMSGSEIYRVFFGVDGQFAKKAGGLLQQYAFLASNPLRTDGDDTQIASLLKQLAKLKVTPDWEPVPRKAARPTKRKGTK